MDIQADSIFVKGNSHLICQDYARHWVEEDRSHVIVSDGCSSSTDTDVGSRLVTLATDDLLQRVNVKVEPLTIATLADGMARMLTLHETCIDATMLSAQYLDGIAVKFSAFGDGIYGARKRESQEWNLVRIEFPNGAPYYPSYLLNSKRFGDLLDFGLSVKYTEFTLNVETQEISNVVERNVDDSRLHDGSHYNWFGTTAYDLFVVLSDGVESFVDKSKSPWSSISYTTVLCELLKFKNTNGEFVTRRVNKFLKDIEKKNWVHEDDLSLAALYIGE